MHCELGLHVCCVRVLLRAECRDCIQPSDLVPADYTAIQEEAQKIAAKTGETKMALQFCNTQRDMRVMSSEMRKDGLLGGTVAYDVASQPRRLFHVCQGCWKLVESGTQLMCSRCGIASYCSTACMESAQVWRCAVSVFAACTGTWSCTYHRCFC